MCAVLAAVPARKQRALATSRQLMAKVFRSSSRAGTLTGFLSPVTVRTDAKQRPTPQIRME
ncbi:hypothetical protein ABIB99_002722 [Bradyrhizobium sp. LA6.1]